MISAGFTVCQQQFFRIAGLCHGLAPPGFSPQVHPGGAKFVAGRLSHRVRLSGEDPLRKDDQRITLLPFREGGRGSGLDAENGGEKA